MSNPLPTLVQKEWAFIQSQSHITARLHRIGHLLRALELSVETEGYYSELDREVHAKKCESAEYTRKSMKWLEVQFQRLQQSAWSQSIQQQISDFTQLIEGKKYFLGTGIVRQAQDLLVEATLKLPDLKEDQNFAALFCKSEGQVSVAWPKYLSEAFKNSLPMSLEEYSKNLTSSPVQLLGFLLILGEYPKYDPLETAQSFMAKQQYDLGGWQLIESINTQFLLKIYFQQFSSKKITDHPITDERLLALIQALLDLFTVYLQSDALLCGPQLKSKLSKDAEKFCIDALFKHMQKLKPEKLKRFTYHEMHKYCQQQAHSKLFKSITARLIERISPEVREMLKKQGIDCKVVRGKAR